MRSRCGISAGNGFRKRFWLPSEFDGIWDAYMKDLDKAGVTKMEAGYDKFVQDRLTLWGNN